MGDAPSAIAWPELETRGQAGHCLGGVLAGRGGAMNAARRREALRLRVREAFPELVEFADELNAALGGGCRITWAAGRGKCIGPVPDAERRAQEAAHGGPLADLTQEPRT